MFADIKPLQQELFPVVWLLVSGSLHILDFSLRTPLVSPLETSLRKDVWLIAIEKTDPWIPK